METTIQNNKKECIFILGGRSGTSALSGALHILGLEIGKEKLEAAPHNPKGFFENRKIFLLNDKILAALNSGIHDDKPLPKYWWQRKTIKTFKSEIAKIINDDFSGLNIFLIKCPRICILLPLWLDALNDIKISPKFIFSVRHPFAIADSIKAWDKRSFEKSILIWFKFLLSAEYFSREYPRVFVRYDDLLEDPKAVIDKICNVLEFKLPRDFDEVKNELEDFLDSGLRHHVYNKNDARDDKLAILADDLYNVMDSCAGIKTADMLDLRKADEIRARFDKLAPRPGLMRFLFRLRR